MKFRSAPPNRIYVVIENARTPFFLSVFAALVLAAGSVSAGEGADLFQQKGCAACHTIGGGRLVGPDLAGVQDRRTKEWLRAFIKSSQSVIRSGDADAKALADQYPGLVMPDQPLTDPQIDAILAHIGGGAGGTVAAAAPTPPAKPTPEQIARGKKLFHGEERLAANGPACRTCHHVSGDSVAGGGVLAVDLTHAVARRSAAGVRAIVAASPFPAMQQAYAARSLTDDEVTALVAYLQDADENRQLEATAAYGLRFALLGIVGAALLNGLYALVWVARKRGPINQSIFERQRGAQ
jgi:mono/diheme cytochrome c family protein